MWDFYPGSAGIFEDDMIISEDSQRSLKSSKDVPSSSPSLQDAYKRELAPSAFHFKNQRSRGRYCHLFILHMVFIPNIRVWVNIFWILCQTRQQQLTFFNQAWEIGPWAWADMRSKFSTHRHVPRAWELAGICFLQTFSSVTSTFLI